jgi:hypothetical protein
LGRSPAWPSNIYSHGSGPRVAVEIPPPADRRRQQILDEPENLTAFQNLGVHNHVQG